MSRPLSTEQMRSLQGNESSVVPIKKLRRSTQWLIKFTMCFIFSKNACYPDGGHSQNPFKKVKNSFQSNWLGIHLSYKWKKCMWLYIKAEYAEQNKPQQLNPSLRTRPMYNNKACKPSDASGMWDISCKVSRCILSYKMAVRTSGLAVRPIPDPPLLSPCNEWKAYHAS